MLLIIQDQEWSALEITYFHETIKNPPNIYWNDNAEYHMDLLFQECPG